MKHAITDISGIGPAAAAALGEHRLGSLKALAGASVETVSEVPGFSTARAQKVIAAATELLAASTDTTAAGEPQQGDSKEKKKGKKNKKDKKKGKKGKKGKGKGKK